MAEEKRRSLPDDKLKALEAVRLDMEKQFGKGALGKLSDKPTKMPYVTSGNIALDVALGIGGYPKGRIIEVYGPESCLAYDTFIPYSVEKHNGICLRKNNKGGTIEKLYQDFSKDDEKPTYFYVKSINENNKVIKNRIADVVKTGAKECFKLTTKSGCSITATKDHKFFNGKDYVSLENLKVGDKVYVHNSSKLKKLEIKEDEIFSIEFSCVTITYDIKCFTPYNNYIANKFVVHNCGKTTLCLHAVAEVQKAGGTAAYIDMESALDVQYARNLGVDIDNLWFSQPSSGEEALEIADSLAKSGAVDIIVVDSVAALTPQAELDGDMGQSHMGLQARLMGQALRKLTAVTAKSNCTIFFINQLRMKLNVSYGNPETTCVTPDTLVEVVIA